MMANKKGVRLLSLDEFEEELKEKRIIPVEVWKVIFLTRAQHYGGAEYLMEIQQNDATKEIRAVKKEI